MARGRIRRIEEEFFRDELSDYALYESTERHERDPVLKRLVGRLKETELKHARFWGSFLGIKDITKVRMPLSIRAKVYLYVVVRRFLGIAFVTKLLERHESEGLNGYKMLEEGRGLSASTRARIRSIIKDEEEHEGALLKQTQKHELMLNYTRSIVFGINDGLVEVLAVVAGVAMVATTGLVVALTGIIVGISGTLSMAAGAYLSSKSERVVESSFRNRKISHTSPRREAYYTGAFYLIGALVATYPFILGATSYLGVAESVISVSIVLSMASVLIAIMSDTSIRRRVLEMLAISLGTAFVTALIGFAVRTVFGVVIT